MSTIAGTSAGTTSPATGSSATPAGSTDTAAASAPTGGAQPSAARIEEMTAKINSAPDFDAKNKAFHESFDAIPESDVATRQGHFFAFMGAIAKPDADRVMAFLKSMDEDTTSAPSSTGSSGSTPAASTAAASPTAPGSAAPGILVIGDSLSVGTQQYLNEGLAGQPVEINATGGIALAEGMRRYDATPVKPRVVEMALFTNNAPGDIEQLRSAVDKTVADARQRGGKVVWATIVRPGGYEAANQLLKDAAAKNPDVMGLVDWEAMIQANPSYLAGDQVHGTPDGYRARAQAFADAGR